MNRPIYLDHNATTPLDDAVKQEIIGSLEIFGNPSSSHTFGVEARETIERARSSVAKLIGCKPEEIFFTSGGTESNNLAIFGVAFMNKGGHIIASSIEHPAVKNPLIALQSLGYRVTFLPVSGDGLIDPEDVKKALCKDTLLITVMHSNNETGMIQPIEEIGRIALNEGVAFHTDASQSIGKIRVDVKGIAVNLLTIAGHKFYGPKGMGALYVKTGTKISPFLRGAGHERGLRPGTENILGIAGLGKACEGALEHMETRKEHNLQMTSLIYESLSSALDIRLNGSLKGRLPNTLNISIKGIMGHELVHGLRDKVALSAGSACHSGICKPSEVLKAMGLSDSDALSAIRISTGKDNTAEEMSRAVRALLQFVTNKMEDYGL